jgi:hypothetical protein
LGNFKQKRRKGKYGVDKRRNHKENTSTWATLGEIDLWWEAQA